MPDDRTARPAWPVAVGTVSLMLAVYVGGYFGLSRSEVIDGTQARVFPSRTVAYAYWPAAWLEWKVGGYVSVVVRGGDAWLYAVPSGR